MKLGFLTGCLNTTIEDKIIYASQVGFQTVEVSCWPVNNNRDYSGSDIDVENLTDEDAGNIITMCEKNGIEISSLAYYDNMLHPDITIRQSYHKHLKSVIRAAQKLNVRLVGTFVGKNQSISLSENFELYQNIFSEFVEYAESHNVKLMIENCPMPGWQEDGLPATISYSPEFWDEMFRLVPSKSLGLNFDPSHLHWLQIDYMDCIEKYNDRIFHVHAKDCILDRKSFSKYGVFGKKLNRQSHEDLGWFTPKIPGLGDISWHAFVSKLRQVGYDGVVSIEHEDRDFCKNNDEVKLGLEYSFNHLNPLVNGFGVHK
ncbi:sugar phosphate isomerase/epimerase family protein [Klebsiella pneumoniae]|uniref:sugar phosphate isomerase/epimerase family protein n=1 Tax=Klebsiella pneumoniae TaxID=573 RepID=UPI001ABC94DF|nr:sugar phosphate isomerase/epimerase [Klebsiella pneumoniae]MBO3721280.1 sugar phosphate isomerase/epimerase [Klebsiella pneumoniae]HCM5830598.1 sugar phosphate isomerase/epimerase [Klebsiella pneumoniae]